MSDPDLVVWLNACYDRAEQRARAATEGPWRVAECGEIETVAAYGIPGYESPLHVTCDNSGGAPAVGDNDAEYIASVDPAWRLADIGRKRKLLALHSPVITHTYSAGLRIPVQQCDHCASLCHSRSGLGCDDPVDALWPCPTVRLLAEEFAGEPGYDERWRT